MSEQTSTDTTEAAESTDAAKAAAPEENLGDSGKKALDAERTARKAAEKSAAALKARLDEIEQANLTELEKAQKAAAEAQAALADVTRQNLVNRVALAKGVPADLAEFLTGDTEDEVAAKADLLLSRLNAPTTPRPDPSQASAALPLNGDGIEQSLKSALGIA